MEMAGNCDARDQVGHRAFILPTRPAPSRSMRLAHGDWIRPRLRSTVAWGLRPSRSKRSSRSTLVGNGHRTLMLYAGRRSKLSLLNRSLPNTSLHATRRSFLLDTQKSLRVFHTPLGWRSTSNCNAIQITMRSSTPHRSSSTTSDSEPTQMARSQAVM